jgi:hypothetical protein
MILCIAASIGTFKTIRGGSSQLTLSVNSANLLCTEKITHNSMTKPHLERSGAGKPRALGKAAGMPRGCNLAGLPKGVPAFDFDT